MGCAPTSIHTEKFEFNEDDIILSDDLDMSDETSANSINESVRINYSILNRKTLYKDELEDFEVFQQQSINQKPIIIKSCLKRNDKTEQFVYKKKKVRFCRSYQICVNGIQFIVKKKKEKRSRKQKFNKVDEDF